MNAWDLSAPIRRVETAGPWGSGGHNDRPIVIGGGANPFAIGSKNLVSPNNPSLILPYDYVTPLKDNHTIKVTTLTSDSSPDPRYFGSGDSIWLKFIRPVSPSILISYFPIVHVENSLLSAVGHTLSSAYCQSCVIRMWVEYLNVNWDPSALCYSSAPFTGDSAKGPDPTFSFGYAKLFGGGEFDALSGSMLPGDAWSNNPSAPILQGASGYWSLYLDSTNATQTQAEVIAGSPTTVRLNLLPFGFNSGSIVQAKFSSPYNTNGNFIGATITINPYNVDPLHPTRLPASSVVTGYTNDGTFTVANPWPYPLVPATAGTVGTGVSDVATISFPIYGLAIRMSQNSGTADPALLDTDPCYLDVTAGPYSSIEVLAGAIAGEVAP